MCAVGDEAAVLRNIKLFWSNHKIVTYKVDKAGAYAKAKYYFTQNK